MEGYRFTIPYSVRVADVNYGGHVANSAVLNFSRMPGSLTWPVSAPSANSISERDAESSFPRPG
jgi:hypothetical protein